MTHPMLDAHTRLAALPADAPDSAWWDVNHRTTDGAAVSYCWRHCTMFVGEKCHQCEAARRTPRPAQLSML